jgi:hypothetical protein
MPARTFQVMFSNNTEFALVRKNHHLCHGDWTPQLEPPPVIPPRTEIGWQSESPLSIFVGTEGWVKYARGIPSPVLPGGGPPPLDLAGTIYIYWKNPYASPFDGSLTTEARGIVVLGDHKPDCDADDSGDVSGGSEFPKDPSVKPEFELFGPGSPVMLNGELFHVAQTENAAASYDDAGLVVSKGLHSPVPVPITIWTNLGIVEHAIARFGFRRVGSVRESLPLDYAPRLGIRKFGQATAASSVRAIFQL